MTAFNQGGVADIEAGHSGAIDRAQFGAVSSPQGFAVGGMIKRVLDVALAGVVLLIFAPLLLMVGLAIWLSDPGPILFGHERVGFNGRRFRCLKFRSMAIDGDRILADYLARNSEAQAEWDATRKLRCDPRVTRLGRVLREYSVDELPQIINVLRGDMSFVGPRPVVAAELDRFGPQAALYMAARPGITGLWQVSGRSDTSYAERVALDSQYVACWSLWRDFVIVLRTIPAVIGARGSY
ncbi:MAG: sugar transferase [Pseudomonadota bacterium]